MAKAQLEHDFFGLANDSSSSSAVAAAAAAVAPNPQPRLDRRQSFRGISRMNPEIVKSVIASASKPPAPLPENTPKLLSSVPGSPIRLPDLPVLHSHQLFRPGSSEKAPETAPMTIFYNGTVCVFDLPMDKAEYIMKYAMDSSASKNNDMDGEVDESSFNGHSDNILQGLNDGDLPIKRKKSLQRFFEKRKERLISVSPYLIDHQYQKTAV